MKNKEKYLTNFSEAKRKKATQKYNIIKPFILGEQSWYVNKNLDRIHKFIRGWCLII